MIIYKAVNKTNGKIYIGQTKRTLKERNRQRKYSKSPFDLAFQKYGEENFEWTILEESDSQAKINEKEEFWISFFESTNRTKGYNIKKGGENHSHDEETKRKIGDSQKGEKNHSFGKTSKFAKKIINVETGKIFNGTGEMIKNGEITLKESTDVLSVCRGGRDRHKNTRYRFLNAEDKIIETKFDGDEYLNKKEKEEFVYHVNEKKKYKREKVLEIFKMNKRQLESSITNFNSNLKRNLIREKEKFELFTDINTFEEYLKKENSLEVIKLNPGAKKTKCLNDGKVFESASKAAKYYAEQGYKITTTTLNYYILGKTLKPRFNLEFVYLD